jgi:hypothetical protein
VNRYRLRFLLQEIDLPQGETLLGRSASCHVTIDDPLVSRQHARLKINGQAATVEDLGSRNGVSVNGRVISGRHELCDNDRIRIGTQELVFCVAAADVARPNGGFGSRPTGFMCHCAACGLPYPAELVECPSCGSRDRSDEETISGFTGDEAHRNWTLELLVEVLLKAVSLQRWDDVERMLRRARVNVDEQLAQAQPLDAGHLDGLAQAASRLALVRAAAEWASWALGICAAFGSVPSRAVCDALAALPPSERALLAEPATRLLDSVLARGGPRPEDRGNFQRVESLRDVGHGDQG